MKELVERFRVQGLESVTLIRDKKTGQSRQFAFAQFSTTVDARRFLRDNYPSLQLFDGSPKLRIAFSKTGGNGAAGGGDRGRREDDEWNCRVCLLLNFSRRTECFRCHTPRSDVTLMGNLTHPTPTFFKNDGSRDVEQTTVSQFLLFRDLSEVVNEGMLAKGVLKLTNAKPSSEDPGSSGETHLGGGAREDSVRRVLLVRNRRGGESWRFGFVEFAGFEDSKAAYEKYQSLSKFTIASKPVSVSFIHSGVFVPIYNTNAPDVDKYTFLADNGLRLAYWDEEGYVSEMVISKEEVSVQEIDKKAEPSKKKGEKPEAKPTKKRKAETGIQDSTSGAPAGTSVKKAIPSHLQFWQDRHMELHGVVPVASASGGSQDGDDDDSKLTASSKRKKIHGSTTATASNAKGASADASVDEGPPKDSFADLSRNACLLCARQFKSAQEVHKHERLSALHRTNIQDEKLVATAREKLAKARTKTAADNGPVYRDRAKERRAVFGQPRKPDHKNSSKSAASEAKDATAPSAVLPAPPVQVQSKGAALLSKMGWSSGEGLGAQGDGIVAPVIAEMYAEGVGLGAAGGKVGEAAEVAGQNTGGGYKDFMKRAKEKAKQRYEEMQ